MTEVEFKIWQKSADVRKREGTWHPYASFTPLRFFHTSMPPSPYKYQVLWYLVPGTTFTTGSTVPGTGTPGASNSSTSR